MKEGSRFTLSPGRRRVRAHFDTWAEPRVGEVA